MEEFKRKFIHLYYVIPFMSSKKWNLTYCDSRSVDIKRLETFKGIGNVDCLDDFMSTYTSQFIKSYT